MDNVLDFFRNATFKKTTVQLGQNENTTITAVDGKKIIIDSITVSAGTYNSGHGVQIKKTNASGDLLFLWSGGTYDKSFQACNPFGVVAGVESDSVYIVMANQGSIQATVSYYYIDA